MDGARIFADLPDLETERLLLRKMRPEDSEAMFAYASDPEVTRYVLWDTHGSKKSPKTSCASASASKAPTGK